jgi:hypothetical protein
VAEVAQDVAQGDVQRVGADHPVLGKGHVDRDDGTGAVLPAAEPASATPFQRSTGSTSTGFGAGSPLRGGKVTTLSLFEGRAASRAEYGS